VVLNLFLVLPDFELGSLPVQRSGNHHVFEPIVMIDKAVELLKRRGTGSILFLGFLPIGMEVPHQGHGPDIETSTFQGAMKGIAWCRGVDPDDPLIDLRHWRYDTRRDDRRRS